MRRSAGTPGVAVDQTVLHLDGAAHRIDDAAKLDEAAVAGALDDAPAMHGDRRVDQIAAQRPESRQNAILVGAGEAVLTRLGAGGETAHSRARESTSLEGAPPGHEDC